MIPVRAIPHRPVQRGSGWCLLISMCESIMGASSVNIICPLQPTDTFHGSMAPAELGVPCIPRAPSEEVTIHAALGSAGNNTAKADSRKKKRVGLEMYSVKRPSSS